MSARLYCAHWWRCEARRGRKPVAATQGVEMHGVEMQEAAVEMQGGVTQKDLQQQRAELDVETQFLEAQEFLAAQEQYMTPPAAGPPPQRVRPWPRRCVRLPMVMRM